MNNKEFKKKLFELFDCGGSNGGLFISEEDKELIYNEIIKLVKDNI